MSGKADGGPDVESQLTVPATAPERLAALEAERERERAAIEGLKADVRKAAREGKLVPEGGRFARTVALGFGLAALLVGGLLVLLAEIHR